MCPNFPAFTCHALIQKLRFRNRKCCGRCCANPPSFTEGKCEYALFLLIILSGAAIVALALHGLANQAEQKEAVDKFGSSFSLMQTLSHSTLAKIGSLENEIDALDATTDALAVTLGALRTTEIQADVDTALGDVYTGISGASNAVLGMGAHLTLLDDQISNMTASVSEAAATFNTYRGTAIACVWISLCGLILWNVLAAIVRQLAPAATDKCGGLFGFFGFIYLVVMFLLGVVCIALSILSILLGDICQDPKSHVATIVSSLAPSDGGAADAGGSGSGWGSGFEGSGDGGASLQGANAFLYYVDCDTNSGSINPFNAKVEETAEMVYRAAGGSEELLGIFGSKQADVVAALAKCTAALPAGSCGDVQTAYDNLFRDRAATQIKLSSLSAAMNALKANAIGKSTLTAASAFDLVVPVQGLDDGLFSAMHCYRMNARYHAVVNLFCSDVFSGMAATLEFLLVAFGLMVLVELLKRLARPYDASYTVVGVAPVDKWAIAQGRDKWAIAQGRDSVSY